MMLYEEIKEADWKMDYKDNYLKLVKYPSARKGKWIKGYLDEKTIDGVCVGLKFIYCSECGIVSSKKNYCPNCGSEMKED